MALKSLPTRQDPRPGTDDDRHARAYDPASGGWTAPVTPAPSDRAATAPTASATNPDR